MQPGPGVGYDRRGDANAVRTRSLKPGGRLVSLVQPPSQEEAAKYGVEALNFRMQPTMQGLERLAELIESGNLKTVVTKTYPLAEAAGRRGSR